MIQTERVGIRRRPTGSTQVGFRLPNEAVSYYEAEAKASGRSKVDILVDALYLDRDLSRRLQPHQERLAAAAQAMGLDLNLDFAEVISKLVEAQLAPADGGHGRSK